MQPTLDLEHYVSGLQWTRVFFFLFMSAWPFLNVISCKFFAMASGEDLHLLIALMSSLIICICDSIISLGGEPAARPGQWLPQAGQGNRELTWRHGARAR